MTGINGGGAGFAAPAAAVCQVGALTPPPRAGRLGSCGPCAARRRERAALTALLETSAAVPSSAGIYTIPEAARLARIPQDAIRRWLWGDKAHDAPPLWTPQWGEEDGRKALGFRDLMEIRFVHAFRQRGVSLQLIRRALAKARDEFGYDWPFSSLKFRTDGRRIFAEVVESEAEDERAKVFDVVSGQYLLAYVIELLSGPLDYEADLVARWWPLGKQRTVVVDPRRSFGRPVVAEWGVPTEILARAARAQGVGHAARWFEVPTQAVEDALEMEQQLEAA